VKLRKIEVENFGIHESLQLDFAGGGLHVVYGLNEAGKSTLLQAVRELIFGFRPTRSNPYAPESASKKMIIHADWEFLDGKTASLTRRQGNKNKISGRTDEGIELDETEWLKLIDGADQSLFDNVFGFSLKELASGQDSLQQANVKEALFGGGLGRLHDYKTLLQDMEAECKNLFNQRGKNPLMNKWMTEISTHRKELKEATLRPSDYQEWIERATLYESEIEQIRKAESICYARSRNLERLLQALPIWKELQHKQEQLSSLEKFSRFPIDAMHQLDSTRDQISKLTSQLNHAEKELSASTSEAEGLVVQTSILGKANDIRTLTRSIDDIEGCRKHIPLIEQRWKDDVQSAEEIVRRISPTFDLSQLSEIQLTISHVDALQKLAKQYEGIQVDIESREPELEQLNLELGKLQDQIDAIPLADSNSLFAWETRLHQLYHAAQQKEQLEDQVQKFQQQQAEVLTSITKLLPAPVDWKLAATIPLVETIEKFERQFDELTDELKHTERDLASLEDDAQDKQEDLSRLERKGQIVTRQQLQAAREQRDQVTQSIQRVLTDPPLEIDRLKADFTQLLASIEGTDQLADQRFDNAQLESQHQIIRDDLASIYRKSESHKNRQADLLQRLGKLNSEWVDEWSDAQISPWTPREMLAWRTAFFEGFNIQNEIDQRSVQRTTFQEQIDQSLLEVQRQSGYDYSISVDQALAVMNQQIESIRASRDQFDKLTTRLETKQQQHQSCVVHLERAYDRKLEIEQEAERHLAIFKPLGEIHLEIARDVIQAIETAQTKLTSSEENQRRVDGMRQDLERFEGCVETVLESIDIDFGEMAAEDIAEELNRRLTKQVQLQSRQSQLTSIAKQQASQVATIQQDLEDLSSKLQTWREQAGVETDEELVQSAGEARRRADLDRKVDELRERIGVLVDPENREAFQQQLEQANEDALDQEFADAQRELSQIEAKRDEKLRELDRLEQNIQQADADGLAVRLQGKISSLEGEVSQALDRLAPMLIARHMLERAVDQFGQENIGEMMVTIGNLLKRMTQGRYIKVEQNPDDESFVILSQDGTQRTAAQLSTGTREQLYLAIRLAYIQHYCDQAEPLPILMDDILVNFDDHRQNSTLEVLAELSPHVQIIMLTCHQALVDKVRLLGRRANILSIGDTPPKVAVPSPKMNRKRVSVQAPSLFEDV